MSCYVGTLSWVGDIDQEHVLDLMKREIMWLGKDYDVVESQR